jgi:hypothetical protein
MQTLETDILAKNHDYQAELARNLIDTLGLDDALDVCARNCWAGIQAVIMSERQRRAQH